MDRDEAIQLVSNHERVVKGYYFQNNINPAFMSSALLEAREALIIALTGAETVERKQGMRA